MVAAVKTMATSFKRPHACSTVLTALDSAAGHLQPRPPPETPGHSWACLGQFLMGSLHLSPGSWCTQDFVCALQESVSPVLCNFWWFYGGVNGDLLPEGLWHTQVCCTQSPCSRPLMTCTFTRDTQTLFWLSLCVLSMHFVPFPGLSSSGGQVFGECTVLGPSLLASWLRLKSTNSCVLYVSFGELIPYCDPLGKCQPSRISGKHT